MALTFKDYVTIADALLAEDELNEGWMDDAITAIKAKLGGKMSDAQIKAEIEKVKAKKADAVKKVGQTQQSKDFHARRAAAADKANAAQAKKPMGTVGTGSKLDAMSTSQMRAGQARAVDRNPFAYEGLNEGLFDVEYTAKNGEGKPKKCQISATDVGAVKEKFKRQYAGWKFVSAKPAKKKPAA